MKRLKRILARFRYWPLHPQWLVYRHEHRSYQEISKYLSGRLLDIGCAHQHIKTYLQTSCEYIGLDYYQTAVYWYATCPQVFADAQQLPFKNESMDAVLLLDVLEHLPHPQNCLREIARVLKPNGLLVLKVPFIYPLHDEPLDFQRWTIHGLQQLAWEHGFTTRQVIPIGNLLETATLLGNIAITKTALNWIKHKNPALLFTGIVPFIIITFNLLSWLFNLISPIDPMMPHSYRLIWEKSCPSCHSNTCSSKK